MGRLEELEVFRGRTNILRVKSKAVVFRPERRGKVSKLFITHSRVCTVRDVTGGTCTVEGVGIIVPETQFVQSSVLYVTICTVCVGTGALKCQTLAT